MLSGSKVKKTKKNWLGFPNPIPKINLNMKMPKHKNKGGEISIF